MLFNFGLAKPPGHENDETLRIKLFEKVQKSVLSQITFYLEDDDHKAVGFIGKLVSFFCQKPNLWYYQMIS